jgi:hypothetical protein
MTLNLFTRLSQSVSKLNKIEQQGVIFPQNVFDTSIFKSFLQITLTVFLNYLWFYNHKSIKQIRF